ncbi:MFS transporter [soil metagenome]
MSKYFRGRYLLVFGTFLLSLLLYIDRICISVAKNPIAASLDLTDKQMGWVLSVFALGYALFQTPAGILADRFGPRNILTAVVCFWSVFTAATGAVWNFISLLIMRFLFGAGEAGAFPGIARAVFSWIPLQERGIVTGINFSGSRFGAAFALPFVAWMISEIGWRMTFFILGVIGFFWAFAWFYLFRDEPLDHPYLPASEKDEILKKRQLQQNAGKADQGLNLNRLFQSKEMWYIMGQYFSSNFTFFFCLTWLFPLLRSKYNLDLLEAGFYASAPLLFGALGNWFSGFLVDIIYKQGKWKLSRQIPAIVGFILAAGGMVLIVYTDDPFLAVMSLSIAIFGADMTLSPSWSVCVDIGKMHSGAVSGTMNMAGNIGAFITALAFPYLLDWTGSEIPFFFIGALLNIVAVFLWLGINPEKELKI